MSFITIHMYIQRIGGTWPVLLGPPDVKIRPVVKGAETDVWSIAEDIPGYKYI